jgi:hypothetical protein
MDQNDLGSIRQTVHAGQNGILPSSAASRDDDSGTAYLVFLKELAGFSKKVCGDNNDNAGDGRDADKGTDGMDQDWDAGKEVVLFRVSQTHPGSVSGGRDNDGNRWHRRDERRISRCLQIIVKIKRSDRFKIAGKKHLYGICQTPLKETAGKDCCFFVVA